MTKYESIATTIVRLERRISLALQGKKKISGMKGKLERKYKDREISHEDFLFERAKDISGRTIAEWEKYYDSYVEVCRREIRAWEKKLSSRKVLIGVASVVALLLMVFAVFSFAPNFVGFAVQDQEPTEEEEPEEEPEEVEEEEPEEVVEEVEEEESVEEESAEEVLDEEVFEVSDEESGSVAVEEVVFEEELVAEENASVEEDGVEEDVSEEEPVVVSSGSGGEVSESENVSELENVTGVVENVSEIVEVENVTEVVEVENVSEVVVGEAEVETIQYRAVIGRPVKWLKKINVTERGSLVVGLPKGAENISILTDEEIGEAEDMIGEYEEVVKKVKKKDLTDGILTGNVVVDVDESVGIITRFWRWVTGFGVTGQVILEEDISEDIIERVDGVDLNLSKLSPYEDEIGVAYYTEAPEAVEEIIEGGKRIVVSADDEFGYEDVLAYSELDVGVSEDLIVLYHVVDGARVEEDFDAFDLDEDGLIDYVEWNVDHLSSQVYELIIEITKAELLDVDRNFVRDVYDEVFDLDDVWVEVDDGEYLRVTFELNLTRERDITIFPRVVSGSPVVEIYEVDGNDLIAEFSLIVDDEYNKVYLDGLVGSQDVFDLKVVGGVVVIDHVIDPVTSLFHESFPTAEATWIGNDGGESVTDEWWTVTEEVGDETSILITNDLANQGSNFLAEPSDPYFVKISECDPNNYGGCHLEARNATGDYWNPSVDNWVSGNISFWYTYYADSGEGIRFQVWNGSSSSWVTAFTHESTGNNQQQDWVQYVWDMPAWVFNQTEFAFRLSGDSSGGQDDVLIDEVDMTVETLGDTVYPVFSNYWDDNATVVNSGIGTFNVTVVDTNGTVLLEVDGFNVTATNIGGDVYNASYNFLSGQDYDYKWHSWGNGIFENYNVSDTRVYTVNSTDTVFPLFSNEWDDNGTLLDSGIGNFNVTVDNTNGSVRLEINGSIVVATNLTSNVYNASYVFSTGGDYDYSWRAWGNGTEKNPNVSATRTYAVNISPDISYPLFSNYWDDNGTLFDFGTGYFNVTIDNTNGTVYLEIDGVNVTATNLSSNVYNVSYYFSSGKDYSYRWHSRGDGFDENYNVSGSRVYTVNRVEPITPLGTWTDSLGTFDATPVVDTWTGVPFDNEIYSSSEYTQNVNDVDIDLATGGHYLALYTVYVTTDYNGRLGYESRLSLGGSLVAGSYASCYSRQTSDDDAICTGGAIINASAGDDVRVEWVYRTDTGDQVATLLANKSSLQIIKLNDNADYIRLTKTATQVQDTINLWSNFTWETELEKDVASFTHVADSDTVTLAQGHYLVVAGSAWFQGDALAKRTSMELRTSLDGVVSEYGRSYSFYRSSNNHFEADPWYITILNVSDSTDFKLQYTDSQVSDSHQSNTTTSAMGLQMVRLPDNANYYRAHGDVAKDPTASTTTPTKFDMIDTEDEEDAAFDGDDVTGDITINSGYEGSYLFAFSGTGTRSPATSSVRSIPFLEWYRDGVSMDLGGLGWYTRGTGTNGDIIRGGSSSAMLIDKSAVSTFSMYGYHLGGNPNEDRLNANEYGIVAVRIDDLFGDVAPEITYVEEVSAQNPVEGGVRDVVVNFSVSDSNGASDIDSSTAEVMLWRSGEVTRVNSSCVEVSSLGDVKNFSCSVGLWYFDGAGDWGVNVSIDDLSSLTSKNSSTSFTYNQLTAMVMSPTALDWGAINLTDVDVGSTNDPIVVNNTGNAESLGINITGYDLQGETIATQYIYAENFSVDNVSEGCFGDLMLNASAVSVANLILERGNNSLGGGQEEIFFCLKGLPSDISSQDYSSVLGAWDIRIVLVVLTAGRRKKKDRGLKEDRLVCALGLVMAELKSDYSLAQAQVMKLLIGEIRKKYGLSVKDVKSLVEPETVSIPVNIFSRKIGALEVLVKYMKENLGMRYSDIGLELGRDQRTIWTAYKKAEKKDSEAIRVGKNEDYLPIEVFIENTELTVLESAVLHLKREGMRYNEIGDILGRDQRNVWGVCRRAEGKISGS